MSAPQHGGPPGPQQPPTPPTPPRPRRLWPLIAVAFGCIAALVLVVGGGVVFLAVDRFGGDRTASSPAGEGSEAPTDEPADPTPAEGTPSFEVIDLYETPEGDAEDLRAIMEDNPLSAGELPDVGTCDLPATSVEHSVEELQALLDAAGGCLSQVWSSGTSDRDLPWSAPKIVVFTWPDIPTNATCEADSFTENVPRMCNLDETLYWPVGAGVGANLSDAANVPGAYLWDLSYYYLVSVMWSSSLGTYYITLRDQLEGDPAARAEATRRYNLQLLCLGTASSGQMPSAAQVSPPLREQLVDPEYWTSDDLQTTPESRASWIQTGFDSDGDLSVCNTWTADADQVA